MRRSLLAGDGGWSVIEAISGVRYNALRNELTLVKARGRSGSRLPLVTASGVGHDHPA